MTKSPLGWTHAKIGDTLKIIRGISFPKDARVSVSKADYIGCLRTTNVQQEVEWDDLWFIPITHVKREEQIVQPFDILISTANSLELVGKVAQVKYIPHRATLGAFISLIRVPPGIDKKFVYFQLASPKVQSEIRGQASTTTNISNVSTNKLAAIYLVFPPLPEQERIVAKIEELFTQLETGTAALKRVQAGLKRYKAAVLKAAVEGRLVDEGKRTKEGELPEGWTWVTIGEIGEISGGLTKNSKRNILPKKMPYIRVANVYANELRLDDVAVIGVNDNEIQRTLLHNGDLLIVEGNGSVGQIGRVAIWSGIISPCLHQNHIIKIRFDPTEIAKFVLFWLLSVNGRGQITRIASSTSGLYTLSLSKVSSLKVPLPPLNDQRLIVAEIERRLSVAQVIEAVVETSLKRAARLRHTVLKSAFEGLLLKNAPVYPSVELTDNSTPASEGTRLSLFE